MKKNVLPITLATLVVSIFGAFLRWLQTRTLFDEFGLPVRGAGISVVYVIYLLLAFVCICVFVFYGLRKFSAAEDAATALTVRTAAPVVISCVLAVILVYSGLTAMFSASQMEASSIHWVSFSFMQRIFGAFAIFAGLCLPFLPAKRTGGHSSFSPAASIVLILFCCYWLVFAYCLVAENPSIWTYAPEILAVAATTLAFYYLAAFFYDRAKPKRALTAVLTAVLLNSSVIFDTDRPYFTGVFFVGTLFLLMMAYLLLENLQEIKE